MSIKGILNKQNRLYALYTVTITVFFMWYLFPSDYVVKYIQQSAKQYHPDVSLDIKGVKPTFPPGLKLSGIKVIKGQEQYTADYLKVAPALLSLLKFAPVIKVKSGLFGGTVSCKVKVPKGKSEKLALENMVVSGVKLENVAYFLEPYLPGYSLDGELDAEGSYSFAGRGSGVLKISLSDLSVKPERPIFSIENLNFPFISADLEMKNKKLELKKCDIDGNEVDISVKGFVFIRNPVDRSTVKISGMLKPERAFIEKLSETMPIQALLGKKMDNDDGIPFKVSGVLTKPKFSLK